MSSPDAPAEAEAGPLDGVVSAARTSPSRVRRMGLEGRPVDEVGEVA